MRYALRNQEKIKESFGEDQLKRMIASLDAHFEKKNKDTSLKVDYIDGEHSVVIMEDIEHTTGIFEFYVVDINYDVVILAYKGSAL